MNNKTVPENCTVRLVGSHSLQTTTVGGVPNYVSQLQVGLRTYKPDLKVEDAHINKLLFIKPYVTGDILHIPLLMGSQVLLTGRYKRSVVTIHDLGGLLSSHDRRYNSQDRIFRVVFFLALRGLKRANHIIAVSHYTKEMLVAHLGIKPDHISVVYSGVNQQIYLPREKSVARRFLNERLGLQILENQPVLLYTGSELPRKNLGTLWKALKILREKYPDLIVLKAGKPAGKPGLRAQTQMEIDNQGQSEYVKFLDFIDAETLPWLYNAADLLVQPSMYEGFSMPTVEAMASGCPVVVSNATCLPEVVGKAGLFFNPEQPEALANQVLRFLGDHHLVAEYVEMGRIQAQKYNWEETAKKTYQIYQTLM